MAKLSDTQLIVLSKAAQRDDGAAIVPDGMNRAVAARVGASLVGRKLMREIRAKPGMPVWRMDENDRPMSLVLLRAGRDAIGVDDEERDAESVESANGKLVAKPHKTRVGAIVNKARSGEPTRQHVPEATVDRTGDASASSASYSPPRAGSKQALIIGMLSGKKGASIDALIEATGWLPHTTRAALTGLRKRGFGIERTRDETKGSIYRIVGQPAAPTGA